MPISPNCDRGISTYGFSAVTMTFMNPPCSTTNPGRITRFKANFVINGCLLVRMEAVISTHALRRDISNRMGNTQTFEMGNGVVNNKSVGAKPAGCSGSKSPVTSTIGFKWAHRRVTRIERTTVHWYRAGT